MSTGDYAATKGFRLGNFLLLFRQAPTFDASPLEFPVNLYATKPALLRLFALDPGLVRDAGDIARSMPDGWQDQAESLKRFELDDGTNVALGILRQAYMTMGRLVCDDDRTAQNRLLGIATPGKPVQDIGNNLTE